MKSRLPAGALIAVLCCEPVLAEQSIGGWHYWTRADDITDTRIVSRRMKSSNHAELTWDFGITLKCPLRLVVTVATTEYVRAVRHAASGRETRFTPVAYRFGNNRPIVELWHLDAETRQVYLEGEKAENFMKQVAQHESLVFQINAADRRFEISEGAKVLDSMRRFCDQPGAKP